MSRPARAVGAYVVLSLAIVTVLWRQDVYLDDYRDRVDRELAALCALERERWEVVDEVALVLVTPIVPNASYGDGTNAFILDRNERLTAIAAELRVRNGLRPDCERL